MEGRGKSRRRSPYRVWKRRGSALLAVLLTLSLMLGDISGLSRVVMAGQGTVREEFRIHREDILKAAEEAIENGEPLSEPLAITSEEEKTEEKYQEILPADGSVYEIFPDIEQVKEVDSLELRIFIRLAEGADPASYTLTGDETLVFLYVNGGDVTAEGRVNIDGYVSEFTRVAAFEGEEEPMQPGGTTGAVSGNGAAGSGNSSGNGAAGGSGTAGSEAVGNSDAENDTAAAESESNGSDSMDPEDSAADLDGETEAESEEVGNGTSEDGMSPEETLPAETQEPSQEPESGAAEETEETEAAEQPSGETPDDETPGDQTDGSEADGTASDENTAEAGTGSADEDKETAGNTENSDAADDSADNENDVKESDAADEASEADEGSAEDNSQADPADTENENAEADKEDGAELEKSDTAENADSNAADEGNEAGSTVTLSLRNIQKVAASLASSSEAETPEADGSREEQEESEADEEDSYYEDNGDPVDEEDAAEAEDEEDIFKKTHDLKGRKYDEAVLDETAAVRAFAAGMEDAGFNREDLLEGAHQLTYTVAEGEARLIYTPEYVRDEAVVTFGIIPAEGMEVYQVTANGEALAETEKTAAIASASEAKRAKASGSDADYDEERAVYYQISQVLEDQTVEIQVVEEGYNDHPAFKYAKNFVDGVTVTVSAEEGILPAGTRAEIKEVTEQVEQAVAEKVEKDVAEEEPVVVSAVLAYDITLYDADGNILDDSWSENGSVKVEFSGNKIEEKSKEADKVEIMHVEMDSVEERSILTEKESINLESVAEPMEVAGDTEIQEISFEAEHFSTYTIVFTYNSGRSKNVTIHLMDVDTREEIGTSNQNFTGEGVNFYPGGRNQDGFMQIAIDDLADLFSAEIANTIGARVFVKATMDNNYYGIDVESINYQDNWWSRGYYINGGNTQLESDLWFWYQGGRKTIKFVSNNGLDQTYTIEAEPNPSAGAKAYFFYTPTLDEAGFTSMEGYTFIGWSATQSGDGAATDTRIDNPGTYIENVGVNAYNYDTYYAIWLPDNVNNEVTAYFYIRTDGIIPFEPYAHGNGDYFPYAINNEIGDGSAYRMLKGTIRYAIAVNNDLARVEANLIFDNVSGDNKGVPTADEIEKAAQKFNKSFDKDTQTVQWYVIKKQGDVWHVDGVIVDKDNLSVSYHPNKGEAPVPPTNYYSAGDTVNVEFDPLPTRNGFEFLGWDEDPDALTPTYSADGTTSFIMPEDNVTLYAIWKSKEFTVSGTKVWQDEDDLYGLRPESIELKLYKTVMQGEGPGISEPKTEVKDVNPTWISKEGNTWNWEYRGLQEYTDDNNKIVYDVEEVLSGDCYQAQTVKNQETGAITITNTLNGGQFVIKKEFDGVSNPSESMYTAVSFDVYRSDNGGERKLVKSNLMPDASGLIVIEPIPEGEYYIVEKSTAPGYLLSPEIKLVVAAQKDANGDYTFSYDVNDGTGELGADGIYKHIYTVVNYKGAELPETGGPGLIMMERFGWMLLLLALVGADVQLFSRRRRKEQ